MKKIILPSMLFLLLVFSFSTCDLINDLFNDDKESINSYDLYTNPTDPTLIKVTEGDGTEVTYYGTKDIDGVPLDLKLVTIQYPGETETYKVNIDENGQPAKIFTPTGSMFEIDPIDTKEFYLSIVSGTGEIRIDTKINLDSLDEPKSSIAPQPDGTTHFPPRMKAQGRSVIFTPFPQKNTSPSLKNTEGNILTLNLTLCGEQLPSPMLIPVLYMKPPLGGVIPNPSFGYNPGQYGFYLPEQSQPSVKIQQICTQVGSIIDDVCLAYDWTPKSAICPLISKLIDKKFQNSNDKQSILSVCDKAIEVLPKLCKINKDIGLENFCELAGEVYLNPNPDQYTYLLMVHAEGKMYQVPLTNFNPNTSSTITYDIPGTFDVTDLYTEPKDPAPNQGYTATALIDCPDPAGVEVTISVSGSDNYSDSETVTLTTGGSVSLYVPGGAQSIEDVITVNANGKSWSTYIVF